jgi:methylenetetrahydrofolate reductase (NADPH)
MTQTISSVPNGQRAPKAPKISFEFFPPKTEEMERNLWETINRPAP